LADLSRLAGSTSAVCIGGGARAKPGEISLSHLGVLFLDELPEFQRATLEALRQPMETGRVSVARANAHVTYPARVQLVAAMNPCPCGHLDDAALACGRAPKCAQDYQSRISGPLFDRIDLHIDVPAVSAADLTLPPPAEGSAQVAARVAKARAIQTERYKQNGIRTNAECDGELLEQVAPLDEPSRKLITQAIERFRLSARLPPRAARRKNARGSGGRRRGETDPRGGGAHLPARVAGTIGI
jgi:magnesium chelatase family protein